MEENSVRIDRTSVHELENILFTLFLLFFVSLQFLTNSELGEDFKLVLAEFSFRIEYL